MKTFVSPSAVALLAIVALEKLGYAREISSSTPELGTDQDSAALVVPKALRRRLQSVPSGPFIYPESSSPHITLPDPTGPDDLAAHNAARDACPHDDGALMKWHDASTWASGIPVEGDDVTIPSGKVVIEQTVVEKLGVVTIPEGSQLIVARNEAGINVDIAGMIVKGEFIIGSETCLMDTPVTITLHGTRPSDINQLPNNHPVELKGINVDGGSISVHGKRYFQTWARLAKTVEVNDTALVLQHNVNWESGQQVLVTTSVMEDHRAKHQNEVFTIGSVEAHPTEAGFSVVHLTEPAEFKHVANQYWQVEAGLLTRTIKIQGAEHDSMPVDPDPLTCMHRHGTKKHSVWYQVKSPCFGSTELTGFGGHIIVQNGGVGMVEGVELFRMGQTNVKARYPMHFHLLGDCPSCYFRDSSVHKSFYRCVAVHGTNHVTVTENVAYDVVGHCYYLEDGVEEQNTISFNLGALIHSMKDIPRTQGQNFVELYDESDDLRLPADVTAAAFYIPNRHNRFIGNAASGGWSGFAFPDFLKPTGEFKDKNFKPPNRPLLAFDGNTAHSSGFWWNHAAAFYIGGNLYYKDGKLQYNGGRHQAGVRPCKVNACEIGPWYDCDRCPIEERSIPTITNNKAFMAHGCGLNSWKGQMEIKGFEAYDSGLSMEAISQGFWIHELHAVCRTGEKLGVYDARKVDATAFRWYDTGQTHIITSSSFKHCGYRDDSVTRYGTSPTRGCGDSQDYGCLKSSSVWKFLAFSDQHTPEIMQSTKNLTIAECGRRFKMHTYHGVESVSGHGQNWVDVDGSASGLDVPTIIASGYESMTNWWGVDREVVWTGLNDGPVALVKKDNGPHRSIGHVRLNFDADLHSQVGKTIETYIDGGRESPMRAMDGTIKKSTFCANRPSNCIRKGYLRHLGKMFTPEVDDPTTWGMPVTANPSLVGPTGGFGWLLQFDDMTDDYDTVVSYENRKLRAPKKLLINEIEFDVNHPLLLSIAYPVGTKVSVTVKILKWCNDVPGEWSCSIQYDEVDSLDKVRKGGAYLMNSDGVLTFRVYQPPARGFVGNPGLVIPTLDTPGRGEPTALRPFTRENVTLPNPSWISVFEIEADCPSTNGIYCDGEVVDYDPDVCDDGYSQVAFDKCCSDTDRTDCYFSDGSVALAEGETHTPSITPTAIPTTQPTAKPTSAPTTSMAPSDRGPRYAGCFNHEKGVFHWRARDIDLDGCVAICCSKGFKHVGLIWGNDCTCSNDADYRSRMEEIDSSQCNKPCKTNPSQICGGSKKFSVFDLDFPGGCPTSAPTITPTGIPTSQPTALPTGIPTTSSAPTTSMAPSISGPQYVGCFSHQPGVFKWRGGTNIDAESCAALCCSKGFKGGQIGLMWGSSCLCSNDPDFRRIGLAPTGSCKSKCKTNPSQICGGHKVLSVYNIAHICPA